MNLKDPRQIVKIATVTAILYLLCFGFAMVFFPIRPFWNDEWRLIYNLKFKNVTQLWGTLDLLQQCPRAYLTAIKNFSSLFDYSYTSLRFPALIIGICSILLCFHLKRKIYPGSPVLSYLFVLILVSSQTFTDYLVQVKHYDMEIFLCLVALWQLITLLEIVQLGMPGRSKYVLLCISFLLAPFFSYTYPICVAPVFPVVAISALIQMGSQASRGKKEWIPVAFPLLVVVFSIFVFYIVDVRQLLADNSMYQSYQKMLGNRQGENHFFEYAWKMFSLVGSGLLFEFVYGVLGITCFVLAMYRIIQKRKAALGMPQYIRLYAVLLLTLTLLLFATGKLMGGVARLTAFTVPSVSILIIAMLEEFQGRGGWFRLVRVLAGVLFAGLFGNIITTCIHTFTYPEYNCRIETYINTSVALRMARLKKIPILYTDGVKGDKLAENAPAPGKIQSHTITAEQIRGADVLCAEVVLKVNPEYKIWDSIAVYHIPDIKWVDEYMKQLPPSVTSALACDGTSFRVVNRVN